MFKNIQSYVFLVLMALCIVLSGPIPGKCNENATKQEMARAPVLPLTAIWNKPEELVTNYAIDMVIAELRKKLINNDQSLNLNQVLYNEGLSCVVVATLQTTVGMASDEMLEMFRDFAMDSFKKLHEDPNKLDSIFKAHQKYLAEKILEDEASAQWFIKVLKQFLALYNIQEEFYVTHAPNSKVYKEKLPAEIKPCSLAEEYRRALLYGSFMYGLKEFHDLEEQIFKELGVESSALSLFGMVERRVAIEGSYNIAIRNIYVKYARALLAQLLKDKEQPQNKK